MKQIASWHTDSNSTLITFLFVAMFLSPPFLWQHFTCFLLAWCHPHKKHSGSRLQLATYVHLSAHCIHCKGGGMRVGKETTNFYWPFLCILVIWPAKMFICMAIEAIQNPCFLTFYGGYSGRFMTLEFMVGKYWILHSQIIYMCRKPEIFVVKIFRSRWQLQKLTLQTLVHTINAIVVRGRSYENFLHKKLSYKSFFTWKFPDLWCFLDTLNHSIYRFYWLINIYLQVIYTRTVLSLHCIHYGDRHVL